MRLPVLIAAMILMPARSALAAHATLLSAEPAAGSVLMSPPHSIRLLFNEAIEAGMSRIVLVTADNHQLVLPVRSDPHDVHALIAAVDSLASGAYRVDWHVVSADGHPVRGNFTFSVAGSSAAEPVVPVAPPAPPPAPTESMSGVGPMVGQVPAVAAILRGFAVGALMALTGLAFFLVNGPTSSGSRLQAMLRVLAIATPVLLLAHAIVWLINAVPDHQVNADAVQAAFSTLAGTLEAVRIGLAILALWAIVLARRPAIGLICGVGALLASSVIGHPAALHPMWAIPLKALHLIAVAAWLGGLLWLIGASADDGDRVYTSGASRVSSIALVAVVTILITGLVEPLLFVQSIGALLLSTYGAIVLAKLIGFGVLVAFGAYHRYKMLPKLATVGVPALQRSVRLEVVVMTVVVLLGGWLAYVPPPPPLQ